MNVYFVTESRGHMREIVDYLNFEIVLTSNGYFPKRVCVWSGWQSPGEEQNKKMLLCFQQQGKVISRKTLFIR